MIRFQASRAKISDESCDCNGVDSVYIFCMRVRLCLRITDFINWYCVHALQKLHVYDSLVQSIASKKSAVDIDGEMDGIPFILQYIRDQTLVLSHRPCTCLCVCVWVCVYCILLIWYSTNFIRRCALLVTQYDNTVTENATPRVPLWAVPAANYHHCLTL